MPLVSFGEAGAAKGLAVTAQGGDPCLWTQYHGAEGGGAWLPKVPSSIPIPSVFRKRRNQPIMLSLPRSSFYRFSPIFVSSLPWCALIHYLCSQRVAGNSRPSGGRRAAAATKSSR